MKILVTAGNTQTPIDRVRCITNVFTGRTGAQLAQEAHRQGHEVTLLTSHPEVVTDFTPTSRWSVRRYRTFDDLRSAMTELVPGNRFDVLIHAAAVSDFEVVGLYSPAEGSEFDEASLQWIDGEMVDVSAKKIRSGHPELWMRLKPTPKLADRVRSPWGFHGVFVKFKLEVGVGEEELKSVAERSREQSDADMIVANTLEGMDAVAWIGDRSGQFEKVARADLAERLLNAVRTCRPTPGG
jgi:phosphopantothenate-cysteine ligase/phosphopantothenoylcysteine decarboxylase/phosphopantothenate--cysteine ligase